MNKILKKGGNIIEIDKIMLKNIKDMKVIRK